MATTKKSEASSKAASQKSTKAREPAKASSKPTVTKGKRASEKPAGAPADAVPPAPQPAPEPQPVLASADPYPTKVLRLAEIVVDEKEIAAIPEVLVHGKAASIKICGLINPLVVDEQNRLVAGRQRYAGLRLLFPEKKVSVNVTVIPVDSDLAKIVEVEENRTRRRTFSILEEGEMLLELERSLEARGLRAPPHRVKKGGSDHPFFVGNAEMADALGLREGVAKNRKKVVTALSQEVRDLVRGTLLANKQGDLRRIAGLDVAVQKKVAAAVKAGTNIEEALRAAGVKDKAKAVPETKPAPASNGSEETRPATPLREILHVLRRVKESLPHVKWDRDQDQGTANEVTEILEECYWSAFLANIAVEGNMAQADAPLTNYNPNGPGLDNQEVLDLVQVDLGISTNVMDAICSLIAWHGLLFRGEFEDVDLVTVARVEPPIVGKWLRDMNWPTKRGKKGCRLPVTDPVSCGIAPEYRDLLMKIRAEQVRLMIEAEGESKDG